MLIVRLDLNGLLVLILVVSQRSNRDVGIIVRHHMDTRTAARADMEGVIAQFVFVDIEGTAALRAHTFNYDIYLVVFVCHRITAAGAGRTIAAAAFGFVILIVCFLVCLVVLFFVFSPLTA